MNEEDAVTLHIRYDQRDLPMLLRRSLAQDVTRRTYPALAVALLVAIPTAVAAVWFAGGGVTSGVLLRVFVGGSGSFLCTWAGFHAFRRWMDRLSWTQARAFAEGQELVFDPDGILTHEKYREWLTSWREVTEVEATPDHVQLSLSTWGGYPREPVIVPRHAFPSFEASEAFVAKVRGFREAAQERPLPGQEVAPDLPADEQVFTLQDDTGPEDLFEGDGRSHWAWDTAIFLAVVAGLLLTFPLAPLREPSPKAWWMGLAAAVVGAALAWRHVSSGPLPATGTVDPGVMWISREGIVRRSEVTGAWGRTSWGWVHEVKVEAKRIVLTGLDGQLMVVPNRIFRDAYQESAIVEAANRWIDADRAAETAKAGI